MKITYANAKVKKYFTDFSKMQRKIPLEWVRIIKKHLNHLEAADNFEIYLSLGIGHPEELTGYQQITYSVHITPNVRLILQPNAENHEEVMICSEIEIEGVCDYQGSKENWYIP